MISSDTTFTINNVQTWFCVPLCLIAVCKIFGLGLGTNPAQAIAFQVAYYALNPTDTHTVKQQQLNKIWSVVVGATIGGALAAVIFEFVYRPYTKVYREELFDNG
jgi:glycerol uptake facilitator-like aquaporin